MAYIGKTPVIGNFQKCDSITVVNGQAAYTLQVGGTNVSPQSENHMLVSLNGILQAPTDSFTVSGSTLTFASNLITGDVIDFVMILGNVLDLGVPSDNTVSLAKLTATGTKDATTFLRGDNTFAEAGGGSLIKLASTTITTGVSLVAFNNTYITSTYDNYKLIGYGLSTSADNQDIGMLMSVDNGSNFATHLSARTYLQLASASGNLAYEGNNNYISLGSDEEGDNSGGINFDITIYNINSTTQYKYVTGMVTSKNQNGLYYGYSIWGLIQSNTAVNYLKVFTNVGGNLDAGTITLYGLEK
jgi:hypothetical protein